MVRGVGIFVMLEVRRKMSEKKKQKEAETVLSNAYRQFKIASDLGQKRKMKKWKEEIHRLLGY